MAVTSVQWWPHGCDHPDARRAHAQGEGLAERHTWDYERDFASHGLVDSKRAMAAVSRLPLLISRIFKYFIFSYFFDD